MGEPSVDAVTFDYWATLLSVPSREDARSRRTELVGAALRSAGHDVDAEQFDAALATVLAAHHSGWQANRQYTYERGVAALLDLLELELDEHALASLTEAFTGSGSDFLPPLTDNITDTLTRLQACGVRIGIICDVGLTPSVVLRRHLERHGVLDRFDHWSFSDDVGVYKPAPAIFAHALAGLGGIDPARAAHVGDLKATDVAGARASGLRSVRYRGDNDDGASDGAEADLVIDDHTELLAALGLA